jgi:hypothetical protein
VASFVGSFASRLHNTLVRGLVPLLLRLSPAQHVGAWPSFVVSFAARRHAVHAPSAQISVAVNSSERAPAAAGLPWARCNAVALVEERLALLDAEDLHFQHDTLYAACAYSRSVGDKGAASAWASRAAENAERAMGKDSLEFCKYAALIGRRAAK